MPTFRPKPSLLADGPAAGTKPGDNSAPEQVFPAAAPDRRAVEELLTKGTEEIQDHLSLVAQIEVKIGRLLETSIEELERAQRLETLTSLIGGAESAGDGIGSNQDSVSGNLAEMPAAYLEREIKALKKMQKLLGIRTGPGEDAALSQEAVFREAVPAGAVADTDSPRKILIIHNDPATVRILRYFLEKENFEVEACSSGLTGLHKASQERPHIILLDILLSGMDGYQVLSRLKRSDRTARVPVFVLSVLAQEADILKAIEGGAADYFTKPFSPQVMIAKIRRTLGAP